MIMWSVVVPPAGTASPSTRCKHAVCHLDGYLYLHGGRNGSLPLKDFWKLDVREKKWSKVIGGGWPPLSLQEHTMVGWNGQVYVFGGEVGFSAADETPLWIFNCETCVWKKLPGEKKKGPSGRRGHSAVVFSSAMYIYGGYQDLKGSSNEIWKFDFKKENWMLLKVPGENPPGRHTHSSVVFDDAMWVYGGMTDLQDKGDFWRLDLINLSWKQIRTKQHPGALRCQVASTIRNYMLIFGGQKESNVLDELWKFHFATETWEKLQPIGVKPAARSQAAICAFLGEANVVTDLRPRSQYTPITQQQAATQRPSSHVFETSFYGQRPNIGQTSRKALTYIFNARKNTVVDGSECSDDEQVSVSTYLSSDCQDSRFDVTKPVPRQNNDFYTITENQVANMGNPQAFIRDLSRISHRNLTRFGAYSSYAAFSNESSMESLTEEFQNRLRNLEDAAVPPTQKIVKSVSSSGFSKPNSVAPQNTDRVPAGCQLPHEVFSVPNFSECLEDQKSDDKSSSNLPYSLWSLGVDSRDLQLEGESREELMCTSDYASVDTPPDKSTTIMCFENPNYCVTPSLPRGCTSKTLPEKYVRLLNCSENQDHSFLLGNSEVYQPSLEMQTFPSPEYDSGIESGNKRFNPFNIPEDSCKRGHSDVSKRTVKSEIDFILLVGGKEVGQINAFQRPLSVWKLELPLSS